jgi:hypothetical protein
MYRARASISMTCSALGVSEFGQGDPSNHPFVDGRTQDLVEYYSANKSPTLPCVLVTTSTFGGGGGGGDGGGGGRSAPASHGMDHEPWFVGMLQSGRTTIVLADSPIGHFVIRESSSSMNSFVLASREAGGVIEYKITNTGGMFGYDAQANDPRAQVRSPPPPVTLGHACGQVVGLQWFPQHWGRPAFGEFARSAR